MITNNNNEFTYGRARSAVKGLECNSDFAANQGDPFLRLSKGLKA